MARPFDWTIITTYVFVTSAADRPIPVGYAVMLVLLIVVCINAIATLDTNVDNTFSYVGNQIAGI